MESFQPSFNIAPTHEVVALAAADDGGRTIGTYRWGLVPPWADDASIGSRMFNARAETLAESRAFGLALQSRRLAILADGFFEWRDAGPQRRRQPLYFHRADGEPLAFAGLWETWHGTRTCTMVTTAAGPDIQAVHDRMPVILGPAHLDRWLDPAASTLDALSVLRPSSHGTLVHHAVDPRVGDVNNDGPHLVAPYAADEPLRLFD